MDNVDVGWGISSACNMKCQFCYSSHVREDVKKDDVGLKDWVRFIDNNCNNITSINYGTGENSLLDDWYDLVEYVSFYYPNIKQAITTNGTLYQKMMQNSRYEKIINNGIHEVDVSLDFADEEKHDELRGLKGAYENAVNMLNYCKGTDIEATLVFIGIKDVIEIENLKGLFEVAANADCKLRTNIFRPMDINDKRLRSFVAKYESIVDMLKWINQYHKILFIGDPLFSAVLSNSEKVTDPSGIRSIRILSNGDITPSTYLISKEFRKINIKDTLLDGIVVDEMGLEFGIPEECQSCRFSEKCTGGVLDRRYLWYKTFNTKDPYCPFREENYIPDFKVKVNPDNKEIVSVHKDYLPTMFFEN